MAIAIGERAPHVEGVEVSGPHALVFYKATCSVTMMAGPPLARLGEAYPGSVIAVGQDPQPDLDAFASEHAWAFPQVPDLPPYTASNAYDYGPTLDQVVADYLSANRPYKPYTDGRISAVAGTTAAADTGGSTTGVESASTGSAQTGANGGPTRHVIVRGDTLWDIAKSAYGEGHLWKKISEANGNPKPRALVIGSELEVPAK